jgi:hypothetical protein
MDEKGITLGAGQSTYVLEDHAHKNIKHIEDGSWELVTLLECICTDGTSILPSVTLKAKRCDLEWSRVNPNNVRYLEYSKYYFVFQDSILVSQCLPMAGPIVLHV